MSAGARADVAPAPAADACLVELLGPAHRSAGTPLVPVAAARGWTVDGQVSTATLRALGPEELACAEGPTADDGVAPRCSVGYG